MAALDSTTAGIGTSTSRKSPLPRTRCSTAVRYGPGHLVRLDLSSACRQTNADRTTYPLWTRSVTRSRRRSKVRMGDDPAGHTRGKGSVAFREVPGGPRHGGEGPICPRRCGPGSSHAPGTGEPPPGEIPGREDALEHLGALEQAGPCDLAFWSPGPGRPRPQGCRTRATGSGGTCSFEGLGPAPGPI